MKAWFLSVVVIIGIVSLGLSGCATQAYVQKQISEIQEQVEANRGQIAILQTSDEDQNEKLSKLSETVTDALTRVEQMREMAEGKLIYEVTLNDDGLLFTFDSSELTDEAKGALDAFAEQLKEENKNCYVEIQGHTDDIGTEDYNFRLGLARARVVMFYLHTQHGIPLNRLNTFSYGESKPIADNSIRTERTKNRRVSLVVMS